MLAPEGVRFTLGGDTYGIYPIFERNEKDGLTDSDLEGIGIYYESSTKVTLLDADGEPVEAVDPLDGDDEVTP
jgi:hypothetical protein